MYDNIFASLSIHPMPFSWMTTLTWVLEVWHFSKSKGRDSLPKQLISYASKYSIRQEENPEPKCGGGISASNKPAWFTGLRGIKKNYSL